MGEVDGAAAEASLIALVKSQRALANLTQTDVAKLMQERGWRWHQPTVQRIEDRSRPLRYSEAIDLAYVLGISVTTTDMPSVCIKCHDRPPGGYTCNTCGAIGGPDHATA